MRHPTLFALCLGGTAILAACEPSTTGDVDRAIQTVNAIDDNNLSDLMLTAADPKEAVAYFQRATAEQPDRIDLQRGLAKSLVRTRSNSAAVSAWSRVVTMEGTTPKDQVDLADALIRSGDWDRAETVLDGVAPTYETYRRYRLEAMVADSNKEWKNADHFYEIAVGLTTTPSSVLNNWGYSKLSRGAFRDAERLFGEALQYDPNLFTAKNNLILARGAQRNYQMPLFDMTQIERAQLMHTMALTAVKQGDVAIGKSLLQDAVDTHPQHFEEASRALRALESG